MSSWVIVPARSFPYLCVENIERFSHDFDIRRLSLTMKRRSVLLLFIPNSIFRIERDRYKIKIDKLRIQNPLNICRAKFLKKKKLSYSYTVLWEIQIKM